ncbi:MAG TPA: hypothetical protein ENK02_01790 [Planctomycetes bacterium]|nr:hypothetical protein [Planctomycetota bacterium]
MSLGFMALYLLFGQTTFYREDGLQFVFNFIERGNLRHDHHLLYLPIAWGFRQALDWTGWGTHRILTVLSGLMTALGVFLAGLTLVQARFGRRQALFCLGLLGFCPAVFFFATVVEIHGVFFPFAMGGFLLAEFLVREEGRRRQLGFAAALGALTWFASLVHSSGHLLLPLLGAWIAARRGIRELLSPLLLWALVHGLLMGVGNPIVLHLLGEAKGGASRALEVIQERTPLQGILGRIFPSLFKEVFISYPPLWVVAFLPLWDSRLWSKVGWALVGIAPYLLLTILFLADLHTFEPIYERGAYLLPLAFPAAWLLSRRIPSFLVLLILLLIGAGRSIQQVWTHDTRPGRPFAMGFRECTGGGPALLLAGGLVDLSSALLEMPEVRVIFISDFVARPDVPLEAIVRKIVELSRKEAIPLYLSKEAAALWAKGPLAFRGKALLVLLRREFSLLDREAGAFQAWELRRK